MTTPVRVRFAPSPTGFLHVGGVRSALFNYLWAKRNNGVFVLRIEDTDQARFVEGAIEQINDSLIGLGIVPDEGDWQGGTYGPYRQSERLELYAKHADELVGKKALYPCWCTSERLDALRMQAQKEGTAFKYDRHCLEPENQQSLELPHVLRFYIPDDAGTITWDDAVRGRMSFQGADLDDFVAMKSDGFPTYQFANVVDDHLMEISHVLRSDEWLPSTPKHLLVFEAFGWDTPIYAHLPPIQGPDGRKKLSKRDGAQSVSEYLEEGYLPEALMSFMASLGWNDGTTQEVFSLDELVAKFSLDRVQKSPAHFDKERLIWMNGYMIRQLAPEALLERCEGFWPPQASGSADDYRLSVLKLVQERLKFLAELAELTDFFFADPTFDASLVKGFEPSEMQEHLTKLGELLADVAWTHESIEAVLRGYGTSFELATGKLFGLVRVALTGRTAAPGLFETMLVLGSDVSLRRLAAAAKSL